MDNKTWAWKKKLSEKNVKKEKILELERYLEDLNEQLSLARRESNAKDELLAKQTKVSEDTIAGWQKAEAETASLKQKLDDVLLQKKSAEERVADRDIALKECMQQLHITKEDQQFLVNNAALKISREQEKVRMLEHKLAETNKRLAELVVENDNLNRILGAKEQIFKEVCDSNSKVEANLTEVMSRLDSSEKLNASLRYELCMLQKEIEIRNEERDYNNRSSNAAHRQHLENVKKIAKLETECQRLRVMVRKRLPGPTALAKMRSEVEVLDTNSTEARKKRSSFTSEDFNSKSIVSSDDASSSGAFSLVDKLHTIEDENKILKESLIKKNNELQASRVMFVRTTSKLSMVEKQLEEFSKGHTCEPARGSPLSCDLPVSSISERGANDDIISCAESWASALVSELEHFKSGKPAASSCRNAGISELSLMDDFVEMEKLAVVSLDKHFESSLSVSGDNNSCVTTKDSCAGLDLSEATGKELVPVKDANTETQLRYTSFKNHPSWLQDILRVIIQKHHIMQKSFSAILYDVRVALDDLNYTIKGDHFDSKSRTQPSRSNLEESVCKIIELVEGIIQKITKSNDGEISSGDAKANSMAQRSLANGYVARSFLWENSELAAVLQNFVLVCNELQCRKVDLEQFAARVASTLEWIVNHCFSLQDVIGTKATMRKHLVADELNSGNELKAVVYPSKELVKLDSIEEAHITDEIHHHYFSSSIDDTETKLKDENEQLKCKITSVESRRKDLESVLKTFADKNETLTAQFRESEVNVPNSQIELAVHKESKGYIEDQIINQKCINEDLGRHFSIAKNLEVELEEQSNCCEELEAKCHELQLQMERHSVSSMGTTSYVLQLEEKQIQADCDITEASKKLAACQETIVNLGKQLKALASPQDVPATAKSKHRLQLVDHMREEDQIMLQLPNMKEIISAEALEPPASVASDDQYLNKGSAKSITNLSQAKSQSSNCRGGIDADMFMLAPKKHKGRVMFLRKLLLR